jgi:hypothetical protein
MRKINKKGDINLSFGVIFSIILIAVFVFVAIYAINFFLNYSRCVQVGNFYEGFQREVSNAFLSQSVENKVFKVSLPSSVEMICFANLSERQRGSFRDEYEMLEDYYLEDANLFLIPDSGSCDLNYKKISRLNLPEITEMHNPYCVPSDSELILTKKIYDSSVLVQKT